MAGRIPNGHRAYREQIGAEYVDDACKTMRNRATAAQELLTAYNIRHQEVVPPGKNRVGNFFVATPELNGPRCGIHESCPILGMGRVSPTKLPAVDCDIDSLKGGSRQ